MGTLITEGQPCSNGHPYIRRNKHGCRDCKRDARQRRRQWQAKRHGTQSPSLRMKQLEWITPAYRSLKKRAAGLPRATRQELQDLWLNQKGKCALTGLVLQCVPQLDHVIPVVIGGQHTVDNLQWVHPMANYAKLNRSVAEFEDWLLAAAAALFEKKANE